MNYLSRTGAGSTPVPLRLSSPKINLDIRQRGVDPFLSGVAIGAVAAILGMLLGLFLFTPV